MQNVSLFIILLYVVLSCTSFGTTTTKVIYPSNDPRFAEHIEILRTALDKTTATYGPYIMKPFTGKMTEARYFREVIQGKSVNVVWGATSIERETNSIPIKIPLTKGLLGYRIGLIHFDMQNKFDQVKTSKDLSKFVFGLGFGWGEVSIYKAAGFQVEEANYENLFKMLNTKRIDFFSRGINEIWSEFDSHSKDNPNISIEKNLLLHCVFPYYFFVTPTDKKLAERIETGLRQMIKDGSFDKIFFKYNESAIAKAKLNKRRVIEILNPNLPPGTPTDPVLWFSPK